MKIRVSDHAVIRYCERVLGLDRTALDKSMADLVGNLPSGRFQVPGHDVMAVVENGIVVTFSPIRHVKQRPDNKRPKKLRPLPTTVRVPWLED